MPQLKRSRMPQGKLKIESAASKTQLSQINNEKRKCYLLSHVRLFAALQTVAHQAPLFMGILQARILEWVAIPFSRESSQPKDRTQASCIKKNRYEAPTCPSPAPPLKPHLLGALWVSTMELPPGRSAKVRGWVSSAPTRLPAPHLRPSAHWWALP